jgi:hypothetical protein
VLSALREQARERKNKNTARETIISKSSHLISIVCVVLCLRHGAVRREQCGILFGKKKLTLGDFAPAESEKKCAE